MPSNLEIYLNDIESQLKTDFPEIADNIAIVSGVDEAISQISNESIVRIAIATELVYPEAQYVYTADLIADVPIDIFVYRQAKQGENSLVVTHGIVTELLNWTQYKDFEKSHEPAYPTNQELIELEGQAGIMVKGTFNQLVDVGDINLQTAQYPYDGQINEIKVKVIASWQT